MTATAERLRKEFEATMRGEIVIVEAHTVTSGDAFRHADGTWLPVLASFAENAATATATSWAIYTYLDGRGEAPRRVTCNPSERQTVRRRGAP